MQTRDIVIPELWYRFYFRWIPYGFALFALIVFFVWLSMPRDIKRILLVWLFRIPCTLALVFNDDGLLEVDRVKGELGQGIGKGRILEYWIKPRPANLVENPSNTEIPEGQKARIDSWLNFKHYSSWGTPILLGYTSKSLLSTAKTVVEVQKTQDKDLDTYVLEGQKKIKKKKSRPKSQGGIATLSGTQKEEPEEAEDEIPPKTTVTLMDPRVLKLYFKRTISPAIINSIAFTNRQIGFYMRPELDSIKKNGGLIIMIFVMLVLGYLLLSGGIPLPFGGGGA